MKNLKVVYMGTPNFAVSILKNLVKHTDVKLVVSQKDAPVGRKKILTPSPVKTFAQENNLEVFTPDNIKKEYDKIIEINPDIIITCAYGQIIPKVLLDLPKYGCINVHASLLPKLRGGAPIHRAIIEGHSKTGITIMYMDEKMDNGDIITKEETEITKDDTLDTLSERLSAIGSKLLIKTLPSIIAGTNDRIRQNEEEVTFAPIIKKEDELIDFGKSAEEIFNQVRGLNSNPGAYFKLGEETIKVYETKIGDKQSEPNVISSIYKDGIGIGTRTTEIILTKIKPAGKNIIDVKSYLNGKKTEDLLNRKVNE